MAGVDWLWILHPFLAVVLVYPLIGVVVRLAVQTRARRLQKQKLPVTVGRDHSDLGRWLCSSSGGAGFNCALSGDWHEGSAGQFEGGLARAIQLLLVLFGTIVSLIALWRCKRPELRLAFSLITWAGVLGLGAQPEVWRLSDNPLYACVLAVPLLGWRWGNGLDVVFPGCSRRDPA